MIALVTILAGTIIVLATGSIEALAGLGLLVTSVLTSLAAFQRETSATRRRASASAPPISADS